MAVWSQSHFLQSLGWATLNSFWQMALLWCLFTAINSIVNLSSEKRYQLATASIVGGFTWFIVSFILFYSNTEITTVSFLKQSVYRSNSIINVFLISASVAYLILLIFPSYRLVKNWKYVQRIKKDGLQKAALNYRLYVQKIAGQLGIKKKVSVYLSELVNSPVTVGYIKPIILLPVAAFNNLSIQQAEAILLHELSHIRRYDYIVNFIISIISTFLYFNPFVKQFMRVIEEERENCCDQLVLHYGYDKVSYATALLTLEKSSISKQVLALGATGKKNLLGRIENIIGMEKKNRFKLNQLTGLLAAFFFIVVFNSVLIIKEEKHSNRPLSLAYNDITNPFHYFEQSDENQPKEKLAEPGSIPYNLALAPVKVSEKNTSKIAANSSTAPDENLDNMTPLKDVVNVNFDEVDGSLTDEQKEEVKNTVKDTKKVVGNLQWQNIENTIADAMTEEEKADAKKEYLTQLDKSINWQNIENNLKSKYQEVDWQKIKSNLNGALTLVQLDSIEKTYTLVLNELNKAKTEACNKSKITINPLPDQSVEAINKSRIEISKNLKMVHALKTKKVIKL
jgi:Antirepressor regulating drug resistance, predicted signal transduction N-terminal membrane component